MQLSGSSLSLIKARQGMESECEAPQLTIFSQYGSRIDRSVKKRFLCGARSSVLSTSSVSSEIGPSVRHLSVLVKSECILSLFTPHATKNSFDYYRRQIASSHGRFLRCYMCSCEDAGGMINARSAIAGLLPPRRIDEDHGKV